MLDDEVKSVLYAWVCGHLLFPCLITDNSLLLLLLLCFLFLIADVPFLDQSMKYIMIRSGKKAWLKAQMGYLLTVSIFLMGFIYISSLLLCLPHLQMMNEWGRIIGTLAQTDAGLSFAVNVFPVTWMQLTTVTKNSAENRPLLWVTWSVLLLLIMFFRFIILKMSGRLEAITAIDQE